MVQAVSGQMQEHICVSDGEVQQTPGGVGGRENPRSDARETEN